MILKCSCFIFLSFQNQLQKLSTLNHTQSLTAIEMEIFNVYRNSNRTLALITCQINRLSQAWGNYLWHPLRWLTVKVKVLGRTHWQLLYGRRVTFLFVCGFHSTCSGSFSNSYVNSQDCSTFPQPPHEQTNKQTEAPTTSGPYKRALCVAMWTTNRCKKKSFQFSYLLIHLISWET